jgi:AcrR family transcriptional regulator
MILAIPLSTEKVRLVLPGSVQQLGRRERSKLDKRRRIREATREVFRRKGYEGATTREIAEMADIAIGTLFAYAADRRELLMMVVNDDRENLPTVEHDLADGKDVLGALMRFFEPRYRYWAKEPEFSRAVVQETVAYHLAEAPGPEMARFYEGRRVLIENLALLFETGQRCGRIIKNVAAKDIASLFMTIYQGEVRQWLQTERPIAAAGLKRLRRSFSLALSGVKVS